MRVLRNSFIVRCLASFLLTTIVSQICFPTVSFALTSGPSQPEVQSFQAANTTDMVNLFSGDFNYNIPLFELPGPNGGYPFNLAYNSGISMDQEASWVGLGWNLNPGALNRDMRGLPDDFNGDGVTREVDMRNNVTFGCGGSAHSVFGVEIAGFDPKAGSLGLGIGMSIFYNSYNGVGYSLDPSANFSLTNKNNMTASIGLSATLNSQEGVGLNPTISMSTRSDNIDRSVQVGLGYNSNAGITGLNLNASQQKRRKYDNGEVKHDVYSGDLYLFSFTEKKSITSKWSMKTNYLGAHYNFSSPSYTPGMSTPTQSRNITLSTLAGTDPANIDLYIGTSGFFSTQYINNKSVTKPGYGYLYMQNDGGEDDLIDYNRSQDGQILKNTPYLPAPILTQDVYSANAQGISAMYRPQRSDLGIIYDAAARSQSVGGSAGPEIGLFTVVAGTFLHFGGDMTVNYSVTNSGLWKNENDWLNNNLAGFQTANPVSTGNALYEPAYFKVYGEMTSDPVNKFDALGGYEPYRVSLDDHKAKEALENDHGSSSVRTNAQIGVFFDPQYNREVRQTSIVPFKNKDLINVNGTFAGNKYDDMGNAVTGGLSEFTFSYFTDPLSTTNNAYKTGGTQYSHTGLNADHIGGFVTTNPNGMKYIYGLPAYNSKKVECQFSVNINNASDQYKRVVNIDKNGNLINYKTSNTNQTNQYFNKVTTPAYAHSYLLTSVLGADYIDADDVVGPSEGDLGYWVKFSYVKANSSYKWRSPFAGANYMRGSNTTAADDMAMYMYGEKEIWHLAKAETQSHVAVFYMSERPDGRSAYSELQNPSETLKTLASSSYKLDKISLFTRNEYNNSGKSLVTANLTYTNELCKGVLNNVNTTGTNGKLTLTALSFTYGDNTRALSPYVFDYHQTNPTPGLIENPDYLEQGYDRWGTYKPYIENYSIPSMAQNNPYTKQFDETDPNRDAVAFRNIMNNQAAVWTLKSIKLPSGGIIDVTYEADDYAYVQNKSAMQMTPISGVSAQNNFSFGNGANVADLKIYFPLETPIQAGADIQKELKKYIPDNNQIYFKTYTTFSNNNNPDMYDYVSGYADIDPSVGSMGVTGTAPYKQGFITLLRAQAGSSYYHPFVLAAWLHVRTAAPYLLNIASMKADPNTDEGEKMKKLASLLSVVTEVRKIFNGFYNECDRKGFGKIIDPSRSFIRLNSPDKIKIGGGLRVKQIVLSDNWSAMTNGSEKTSYYGQVYNYTMEENGAIISSGVATNEPQVGNDESPLRYTESYTQKVPGRTPNRLLVEHPINEAYYPGESVGYRKVTVKSIAAAYSGTTNNFDIPAGILRSGAIVYDFYTAKEYPVIEKYTNTVSHPTNIPVPIPFIGRVDINKLTMSQGFYIELNDMHGKLKATTSYGIDKSGNINPQPVEYTRYNYQSKPVYSKTGNQSNSGASNNGGGEVDYYTLDNKVNVLLSDEGTVVQEPRYMGQDVEFFTDMRETETQSYSGGVNINFEMQLFVAAGAGFPNIQPSANFDYARCRTAVSNKIVHKSGIVTSIENFKDGSKTVVQHKLFDPFTGQPLLTVMNNSFEDPVFRYELPAHLVKDYNRMGGKYVTQGVKFTTSLTGISSSVYSYGIPLSQVSNADLFQKGDRVFVNAAGTHYPAVITSISKDVNNIYGNVTLLNNKTISNGSYTIEMYDPVYDNNYDENAFTVTSLQDPTIRGDKACTVNYIYPDIIPCVNGEARVPGFMNTITSINQYLASPLFSTRGVYYTAQTLAVSGVTNAYSYMQYVTSGGGFNLASSTNMSSYPADMYFYYPSGSAVNFDQVDYLQRPEYTGTTAPTIPGLTINTNTTANTNPLIINQFDIAPDAEIPNFYYSTWKTTVHLKDGTTADAYILYHRSRQGISAHGSIKDLIKTDSKDISDASDIQGLFVWGDRYVCFPYTSQSCSSSDTLITGTSAFNFKTLSKILNVSATTFSEFKPLDNNSVANKAITATTRLQDFDQLIAYLNGSAGTFRPKESWVYLDERAQTTNVNLKVDGTFSDVPFFRYNSPLCKGCPARWKKVVMYTDYFPSGTPQEEEDVLGNKSAVLFGYSGAQVTAVAANTNVYEIGFDGFEDYPNTSSTNVAPALQNYYIGKSNLNFYNASMNRTMDAFANYKILTANKNMLIINKPYNTNIEVVAVDVDGQDIATGKSISGRYTVQLTKAYPGDASKTILVLNTNKLDAATPWTGTAKFKLKQSSRALDIAAISGYYVPSINSTSAHTGKSSLTVVGSALFEQRRLILTPGKKMVFEAWVKKSPGGTNAGVRFYDKNGALITASNVDFGLTTITVEGWTKIYGEFVVPANAESLGIYLSAGGSQYGPYGAPFDDIRVYPAESNMVSYVYDRSNFRLMSVLDNNNFATYYYYNPSGGLYLTKKETERGIMTIQEVQSQAKTQ